MNLSETSQSGRIGEIAEKIALCFGTCADCIFLFGKTADMRVLDSSHPTINTRNPLYPFNFIGIAKFSVAAILCMTTSTQILSSIIESIMISVVALFIHCTPKNHAMHRNNRFSFSVSKRSGIKTFRVPAPLRVPVPLVQPIEVGSINNSVLALRKRDEAYRLIFWLRNRVPLNTVLWHEFLRQGICATQPF